MEKLHSYKKDNYITFMSISGPDERIKNLRISKNLLKCIALFSVIFLTCSVTAITGFLNLRCNYGNALDKIEYLHNDNLKQRQQISSIYIYNDQVRQKMENLIAFDGKVRDMVGLRDGSSERLEEFVGVIVATRGGADRGVPNLVAAEMVFEDKEVPVMMSTVNRLNSSIQGLSSQMDVQKSELDQLLNDVDARLAYLEARPSYLPVYGRITSRFGGRRHPFSKRYQFHEGVDIAAARGTAIKAAGKGTVVFSGRSGGYGNVIRINHGYGLITVYAHNDRNLVKVGDKVEKGQVIARVGSTGISTGPHVHFEIHVNGKVVDPLKFIKGS